MNSTSSITPFSPDTSSLYPVPRKLAPEALRKQDLSTIDRLRHSSQFTEAFSIAVKWVSGSNQPRDMLYQCGDLLLKQCADIKNEPATVSRIRDYFAKAADAGYPNGFTGLGDLDYALEDYDSALAHYDTAIEKDNETLAAWFGRGNVYSSGPQRLKDNDKALKSYLRALESNDPRVMNGLSRLYLVKKEYDLSFMYAKNSALLDDAEGWYLVGGHHFCGYGTEINHKIAFGCYEKAAQLKYPWASYQIGMMLEKVTHDGVIQHLDRVIACYFEAANNGIIAAQIKLESFLSERGTNFRSKIRTSQ